MPAFNGGVSVHFSHGRKGRNGELRTKPNKYLRIRSGPQRGELVHVLIMEAKLGRKLVDDETVEHLDGDGLNVDLDNLIVVTKKVNTELRWARERAAKTLIETAQSTEELVPWNDQF